MVFQFDVEKIVADRGKLSREDRHDLTLYFMNTKIEAEDELAAYRRLAKLAAGRLSKESTAEQAAITLPDYGNCQILVRAYADHKS